MILGFKQKFPWGEPTYFREKILAGAGYGPIVSMPKIHTIREGNRWKADDHIHMAYGVRTKNYQQFNKEIEGLQKVVSVQYVEIGWLTFHTKNYGKPGFTTTKVPRVRFGKTEDWYPGYCTQIIDLAKNDGFDSIDDFWKWFNKDFEGQIISWTDHKYGF